MSIELNTCVERLEKQIAELALDVKKELLEQMILLVRKNLDLMVQSYDQVKAALSNYTCRRGQLTQSLFPAIQRQANLAGIAHEFEHHLVPVYRQELAVINRLLDQFERTLR